MSTSVGDFDSINTFLAPRSYLVGYVPSSADVTVASEVKEKPDASKYPHLARWYKHILSFSESEKGSFPKTEVPSALAGGATPNGKAAPEKKTDDDEDEDDDFDMFGSDDEEENAEKVQIFFLLT